MKKKDADVKAWLQAYTILDVPEDKIDKITETGKIYMDSADFNRDSSGNILLSQMQYLPHSFWIVHAVIVIVVMFLICCLGNLKVPLYYPFTILAITTPLFLLLSARAVSNSYTYDMWEIEQSSRCQLIKIVACRMVIVGLFDLFFLTAILALVSYYFQQSLLRMVLYGMIPFNISCICYLWTITHGEKKEMSYHLIVCMVCISVIFSLVMRQPVIFEASMFGGWIVLYVITVFLLGKAVQKYLQHEKMLGEFAWNLQ